ncbi:MAG: CaiB/BaiF CoA-transferase family protein, partial [Salinisphaeraceae bacterium]|nr:CaiB/BaiF CoA-transferase family protein [Salinisphaeraceae bacterium]
MGPLNGIRIIELAGIGPGPFCGMMLADMGAEVIHIDRPGGNPTAAAGHSVLFRNRRSLALNLKTPEGAETVLRLCESADAIFEGFRPGVAERLGVGPEHCMGANPKIVYGRMTGWGQTGPMAQAAGHDINYISLSGALHAIGRRGERPMPPLNLVGDFGGGGMMLAYGMVCALLEAQKSGKGQVVDSSMVEGSAALMAMFYGLRTQGMFNGERGTHMLDTGAPFYEVYETSDGQFVSIGSIEPQFYALLSNELKLDPKEYGMQFDMQRWPEQKEKLAALFKQKTRDEWCEIFEGTDVCFAPVLSIEEAPAHPHNKARESFVEVNGHP